MNVNRLLLLTTSAMACSTIFAAPVVAQTTAPEAAATTTAEPQAAAPQTQAGLEEIVITAQKREQALQDVPIAVTAMTGATMAKAGVVDMKGVATLVPSLKVVENSQPIGQSYRVRGIGSDPNIPTFEPEVGLFIDGVYMQRSGLGVDDLVDIERIEVLEGPQSTLYGKNVAAGVINVVTKAPADSFEAKFEATVSRFEGGKDATALRLAGSVSGPLSDRVRARVTAVGYHQDHLFKNLQPGVGDANNLNRFAVRGQIELDLSNVTSLRIAAAHSEIVDTDTANADLFSYTTPPNAPLQLLAALGPAFGLSPCPDNDPDNRIICTTDPLHYSGQTNSISATLNSRLGENTLTSISAWSGYKSRSSTSDVAQVLLPIVTFEPRQKGETLSQEFRLASPTGKIHEWLVGAYFLHSDFTFGGKSPAFILGPAAAFIPLSPALPAVFKLGQNGDIGFVNSKADSDYFAVFGQDTWHIDDHFALTAGLRWQTETKHASIDNSYAISPLNPMGINLISAVLTPTSVNAKFRNDMSNFVGNITGQYRPTDDAMIYLTYSRGAKSGGTNIGFGNAPIADRPFGKETVNNYEAGAKLDLFDKRARVALSAFHTVYSNYQNAGFVGLQFLVNNAEKVIVDGITANGAFALTPGLTATAAVTYLDARYDKYTGGACHFPTFLASCDLSGQTLPFTPDWRTNLGLQYQHKLAWGSAYGRVDWSWSSKYMSNTNLDPRNVQSAYSLVNLRVGAEIKGGLDVSVFANNLFDETVIVQDAVSNLFGTDPSFQRYLGAPREIGLTLRKSF